MTRVGSQRHKKNQMVLRVQLTSWSLGPGGKEPQVPIDSEALWAPRAELDVLKKRKISLP